MFSNRFLVALDQWEIFFNAIPFEDCETVLGETDPHSHLVAELSQSNDSVIRRLELEQADITTNAALAVSCVKANIFS